MNIWKGVTSLGGHTRPACKIRNDVRIKWVEKWHLMCYYLKGEVGGLFVMSYMTLHYLLVWRNFSWVMKSSLLIGRERSRVWNTRFWWLCAEVASITTGTFTPLVFTTTGGMADECLRYHSRLAELLSAKKQESYATTISWVRAKVSFAILRSALLCLRGSRTPRRRNLDVKDRDLEIEKGQAGLP